MKWPCCVDALPNLLWGWWLTEFGVKVDVDLVGLFPCCVSQLYGSPGENIVWCGDEPFQTGGPICYSLFLLIIGDDIPKVEKHKDVGQVADFCPGVRDWPCLGNVSR